MLGITFGDQRQRGQNFAQMRLHALRGEVGVSADCTVYAQRPSPCRELQPAWEHGQPSLQCDRARAVHGLRPLAPEDWG